MKFANGEVGVTDMLLSFSSSSDFKTAEEAKKVLGNPPNLEEFKKELKDAVRDLIKDGPDKEFAAFVNHYMEDSLEEDLQVSKGQLGEDRAHTGRIKNSDAPWIQGFVCYNLSLYIKAFGLGNLKQCRVCDKFFDHKGKYAVYCSDECKKKKGQLKNGPENRSPEQT